MNDRATSGIIIRLLLDYVRQTSGVESLDSLLLLAGEQRPLEVLEDSTQWSSYAERVALFEGAT
ncbi:MAG: hypothetical protein ACRDZ5_10530, partial [Acidimicrobiales bacterium]